MTSIATPAQSGPMLAETFAPILHVLTFDTIDDPAARSSPRAPSSRCDPPTTRPAKRMRGASRSVYPAAMAGLTAKARAKPPPIKPTRANIRGMKVILYGEVEGMTRAQVAAALTALGATVLAKRSPNADCALYGAEPRSSKQLERYFLWRNDRVKSYGPKTLLALLGPVAVAAKQAAKTKSAAKKTATKTTATKTAATTTTRKRPSRRRA